MPSKEVGTCDSELSWSRALRTISNHEAADESISCLLHLQCWVQETLKNSGNHIAASHSRQPLVKGERLVRYEVNAVMLSSGLLQKNVICCSVAAVSASTRGASQSIAPHAAESHRVKHYF